MPIEPAHNLSPEVVTNELIHRCISATNKVWNRTYYEGLIIKPEMEIVVTPALPDKYLNSAQAVSTPDLTLVEKSLEEVGITVPAIFIDPLTPMELLSQMEQGEYTIEHDEIEVWRLFDLRNDVPNPDTVLKIPEETIALERWKVEEASPDILDAFLGLDRQTNEINDETLSQIRKNLMEKKNGDVDLYIFLSKIDGDYRGCLCLGIADNIGILSEAGVLPEYRGKSIFPWMRLKASEFTKSKGGEWMASSVLSWNLASHRGSDKSGFIRGFERHLYIKK